MSRPLIILGGGEHARVVAEIALSRPEQWNVVGFVDPGSPTETLLRFGLRHFKSDAEVLAQESCSYVIGIARCGSVELRRRIAGFYERRDVHWARLVHATAWVSQTAAIGAGTVVSAGTVVNSGARIGVHCVINTRSVVEHDLQIGDFTIVAPGALIGGTAVVGDDCYLGLGCCIRDHITVGRGVTVGMGSVVVGSLPDAVTAFGTPAKLQRIEQL
jgi:acetyltransferase EpsM